MISIAIMLACIVLMFIINKVRNKGIYGMFSADGKAGFVLCELTPKVAVSKEESSFVTEMIYGAGGIALDGVGFWLVKKKFITLGLKFTLKPGPISDEYRKQEAIDFPGSCADFKKAIKNGTDQLPDEE